MQCREAICENCCCLGFTVRKQSCRKSQEDASSRRQKLRVGEAESAGAGQAGSTRPFEREPRVVGAQAYLNVVLTLLDSGDAACLFRPYYFNHLMALQMTGAWRLCMWGRFLRGAVWTGACQRDVLPAVRRQDALGWSGDGTAATNGGA
eukprot:4416122-Pleurochrysis_carterae.AAC.3